MYFIKDMMALVMSLWPRGHGDGLHLGVAISIPGSVGYTISNIMSIEPKITWVLTRFNGYIWLDTKIVLKKLEYS